RGLGTGQGHTGRHDGRGPPTSAPGGSVSGRPRRLRLRGEGRRGPGDRPGDGRRRVQPQYCPHDQADGEPRRRVGSRAEGDGGGGHRTRGRMGRDFVDVLFRTAG
ncbi:unnamed protein product, partial [Ectocarpus sp. 12 AP-2014]